MTTKDMIIKILESIDVENDKETREWLIERKIPLCKWCSQVIVNPPELIDLFCSDKCVEEWIDQAWEEGPRLLSINPDHPYVKELA